MKWKNVFAQPVGCLFLAYMVVISESAPIAAAESPAIVEHEITTLSNVQLDYGAQQAGFSDADYPFYSHVNGCGPDGWKGKLIPDKSHVWEGVDWTSACNVHDRDYMTIGK